MWYIHVVEYYLAIRKKWSTDACYNNDELRKHYAKLKKPDTKGHVLYHFIYIKYLEMANP